MRIKKIEDVVLDCLTKNARTRTNDFILYGAVLKRLGIDLNLRLYEFLANAKLLNAPSFETVTRCRRHIQELKPELSDMKMAIIRETTQEEFKNYNITGIGE